MLPAFALLLAAAPLPQNAVTVADTLAPAREGKLRCVGPNPEHHSCTTLVHYTIRDDGSFDAHVVGVVSADPLILLDYTSHGQIEEGAACGMVRAADFLNGTFTQDGKPLGAVTQNDIKGRLLQSVQAYAGQKRCYRDRSEGMPLLADVTMNGRLVPEMQQSVIWVRPEDGYQPGL